MVDGAATISGRVTTAGSRGRRGDHFRSRYGDDGVVLAAGNAERGDKDVHQHDEIEQVGRGVLPARDAAERRPFAAVLAMTYT